jgi:hypothetical protein
VVGCPLETMWLAVRTTEYTPRSPYVYGNICSGVHDALPAEYGSSIRIVFVSSLWLIASWLRFPNCCQEKLTCRLLALQ